MWCQLLLLAGQANALAAPFKRWLETDYPYQGPAVPIADIVDQTVNGDGTGFARLYEAPAVQPQLGTLPTNNINVISLAYTQGGIGMNIHFQTPYGIGCAPYVLWGTDPAKLDQKTCGWTSTYDRTPPCSMVHVTQCSQFFHNVNITNLQPATKYYYQIPGGNGTRASDLMWFTTGRSVGDPTPFTAIVVNDMGYTNAKGTHEQMVNAISEGAQFVWHGGDISYADDWQYGIAPCAPYNASLPLNSTYQQVCYNGSMSTLPGGIDDPDYYEPLPKGEIPAIGSNLGGDMSTMYEPNWDLWQQWMMPITRQIPYMTTPGNHEASCSEGDNTSQNETTAILVDDKPAGSSAPVANTTYGACPYSQRNFTAYRNRFTMPGKDSVNGSGNMWYSFSYGLAHFISFTGETDYPNSPEKSFADDLALFASGDNETQPTEDQTFSMDSGPFGQVTGNVSDNESYEQWNWMKNELASIDRSVTPWVFVMSHRPMYSTTVSGQTATIDFTTPQYQSSYQPQMRDAWEDMFIQYGVDAYFAGHIHWNERMFPIKSGGQVDMSGVSSDNHTYITNPGTSLIHLTNGQAGNVESHTELLGAPLLNITAFLDYEHYGLGKLSVMNATMAQWQFVHGETGVVGDYLTIVKKPSN